MEITPLFAVDAEELLEKGQVNDALELCKLGLEAYPGYPAGEAVLARIYKVLGNSEMANEILETAMIKNPFNKALETLKKYDIEIPKKEVKILELETNSVEVFENESDSGLFENDVKESENYKEDLIDNSIKNEIDNEDDESEVFLDYEDISLITGLENPTAFLGNNFGSKFELMSFEKNDFPKVFDENYKIQLIEKEDDYKKLASKIENAKKIKLDDSDIIEPHENKYELEELVTETMADIFFEQGAYDEAIKAFNALIKKHPEKEDKFNLKIEEIKIEKEQELEINKNNKFFKEK